MSLENLRKNALKVLQQLQQSHFVHLKFATKILTTLGGGNDVPLLPAKRREQLHRGVGGGDPVHRLQTRQQGRHSRSLRGTSGQFFSLPIGCWVTYSLLLVGWRIAGFLLSCLGIGRQEDVEMHFTCLFRLSLIIAYVTASIRLSHQRTVIRLLPLVNIGFVKRFILLMRGIQIAHISFCMILFFSRLNFPIVCTINDECHAQCERH